MPDKKAQSFSTNPFFYLILACIVIVLLYFGMSAIRKTVKTVNKVEMTSFLLSINQALRQQSQHSYGSTNEQVFTLPVDITQICIIDFNRETTTFLSPDFSDEAAIYTDRNILFSPSAKYEPGEIVNFELDEKENPLCISVQQGKIKLKFTSLGNRTKITSTGQQVAEKECVSVLYNGNPDNKIDITFIGQDFKDISSFIPTVEDYIHNIFLDTEPFKSHSSYFNFYRIDDFTDLGCTTDGYIFCNEFKVKEAASNCPHDYIIVLMKKGRVAEIVKPLRSSAYGTIMNVNTADDKLVIMHEFGHSIANLADEYVDDSYYANLEQEDYPNCDAKGCTKWAELNGAGCFSGCSLSKYYRATDNSIMNNFLNSDEYGILNNKVIIQKLQVYG